MSTNLPLLYSMFGLAGTGGKGDFLMSVSLHFIEEYCWKESSCLSNLCSVSFEVLFYYFFRDLNPGFKGIFWFEIIKKDLNRNLI